MASILDSSEFVPDPPNMASAAGDPFGGDGPALAASGNVGALQRALLSPASSAARPGALSPARAQQLEDSLFSRIRSPEQMQAATDARRGALSAYQQALAQPENDWNSDQFIAKGISANDRPWDIGYGLRKGLGFMDDAELAKQKLKRTSGIDSGKAGLEFERKEEELADKEEKAVIGDAVRLATASMRGQAMRNGGFVNVPGRGLVNLNKLDEAGNPTVVVPSAKVAEMWQTALTAAQKLAESPENQANFRSGPEGIRDREAWIQKRAREQMAAILGNSGLPGGAASGLASDFSPNGSTSQSAPTAKPVTEPLTMQGADAAGNKVDFKGLSPELLNVAKGAAEHYDELVANGFKPKPEQKAAFDALKQQADVWKTVQAVQAEQSKVQEPSMVNKVEQKAQIKGAETAAENEAKFAYENYHQPAEAARATAASVQELKQIPFNSGSFANWKKNAGNVLEALGFEGSAVNEAKNITEATRILQGLSNARISKEKGVQTRDDEIRIRAEMANVTDPEKAYQFMLDNMMERSQRAIDRSEFAKQMQKEKGSTSDVSKEWDNRLKSSYGPSFIQYGGEPMFRHQFIDQAVEATLAKNPGADEAAVRQRAAQEWLNLANKRKSNGRR